MLCQRCSLGIWLARAASTRLCCSNACSSACFWFTSLRMWATCSATAAKPCSACRDQVDNQPSEFCLQLQVGSQELLGNYGLVSAQTKSCWPVFVCQILYSSQLFAISLTMPITKLFAKQHVLAIYLSSSLAVPWALQLSWHPQACSSRSAIANASTSRIAAAGSAPAWPSTLIGWHTTHLSSKS